MVFFGQPLQSGFLKSFLLGLFLALGVSSISGASLSGRVSDSQTGEPLVGVTVRVAGLSSSFLTDEEGKFSISLGPGTYSVRFQVIGYAPLVMTDIKIEGEEDVVLDVVLTSESQDLGGVVVTGRKNLEGERALLQERKQSSIGIENLGAREMSLKGIGNVQEGVKKITGVSVADKGQLIVRGLGDRYSSTTLNGLPIASPNPDDKLIPLDVFPANTVQNITVKKVYEAEAFADYSGAHIDISTKQHLADDFFSLGLSVGGAFETLGKDFFQMDRDGSLLRSPSMDKSALSMSLSEFDSYVLTKDIFNTSFDVSKKRSIPDFDFSLGGGKSFFLGSQKLSLLASATASHGRVITQDAFYKTLEATGNTQSNFSYTGYTEKLNIAALACAQLSLREADLVGYTFFYARNASDTYQLREGTDAEGNELIGSNDITHIYTLLTHQLHGQHDLSRGGKLQLSWSGSYSSTGSDEPDRRQVMFVKDDAGALSFFKLNRQETMRYFGELDESEWNGDISLRWQWREGDHFKAGFALKDKDRDYMGTRFYYNVNKIYDQVSDFYHVSTYLNAENIASGTIVLERKMQPKDSYRASNTIYAGYFLTDWHPVPSILLNVGVRYEYSKQWVNYATDGGERYAERRDYNKGDFFPTVNAKYNLSDADIFRFSLSRTVTRPSFIEMAPFLYQESYGGAQIRGNAELENGYNFNFDLRYERFAENGDMISLTGYFKYLDSPIERVQGLNGGATVHTFRNADSGLAAGAELEIKKQIVPSLRLSANVSYMYTDVKLPESGAYTNKERSLQGASPILVNADLTYTRSLSEGHKLSAGLLYNLQGRRIHSVGVSGLGDVKQQTVHTLNLQISYELGKHWAFKLQGKDLLNRAAVFKQDVPSTGEEVEVERYKRGASFAIGVNYQF